MVRWSKGDEEVVDPNPCQWLSCRLSQRLVSYYGKNRAVFFPSRHWYVSPPPTHPATPTAVGCIGVLFMPTQCFPFMLPCYGDSVPDQGQIRKKSFSHQNKMPTPSRSSCHQTSPFCSFRLVSVLLSVRWIPSWWILTGWTCSAWGWGWKGRLNQKEYRARKRDRGEQQTYIML